MMKTITWQHCTCLSSRFGDGTAMTILDLMPSLLCIIFLKLLVLHFSMGVGVQSKAFISEDLTDATRTVKKLIGENEIVIFSKTYCPYCKMAKEAFDALHQKYKVIELDQRPDGSAIQAVLGTMTGVRTVPRVFVHGKCIGGGNEIKVLYESGALVNLLKQFENVKRCQILET